jgi:hypothetical protein
MIRLFDRYAGERREGERFYEWARRMPNDGLRNALTPLPPSPIAMREGGRTTGGARATDLPEVV